MNSPTETSWISILIGAAALGLATFISHLVNRFDPKHQLQAKQEEQKAEAETWQRARELLDSYAKDRAKSDEKIAKLEANLNEEIDKRTKLEASLNEEIGKRAKLEEELRTEIRKRDIEIADLKEQIKSRDAKIEALTKQVQAAQGRGRSKGGLTG